MKELSHEMVLQEVAQQTAFLVIGELVAENPSLLFLREPSQVIEQSFVSEVVYADEAQGEHHASLSDPP